MVFLAVIKKRSPLPWRGFDRVVDTSLRARVQPFNCKVRFLFQIIGGLLIFLPGDAGVPGFKSFSNVIKEEKDNTVRTLQKLLQHRAVL
jgi:hypothetical protein